LPGNKGKGLSPSKEKRKSYVVGSGIAGSSKKESTCTKKSGMGKKNTGGEEK